MSVPADKLINKFNTVEEAYEGTIETYKKLLEISDRQLESHQQLIVELEGKSQIQDNLIETLTKMNERYEVLLRERDEFIASLRII